MWRIEACPICASGDNEPVAEFNGLIAHAEMRQTELCRYDYRLCGHCGTVFAASRPVGDDYRMLYERFNEMLGREGIDNPIVQEGPVTPTNARQIAARPVWWNLSEHEGSLAASMRKEIRLQTPYLSPLVTHCRIEGAHILEIRSKMGFMASFLTRVLGARDAKVMITFPTQQAVVEELHGLTATTGALDEDFRIPFDGPFDIIIVPHVFIHALEPAKFFAEIRRIMAPKGWLMLCQEPDDERLFDRGKNLFSELKCFHFQQVDCAAYARALESHGFKVAAVGHKEPGRPSAEMWALARLSGKARLEPIAVDALRARRAMYERWRDESVLALPEEMRALFAADLTAIEKRALSGGYGVAADGRVRPARDMHMTYEEGFARQNAARAEQAALAS
jgi:SAM-dependent methyltransferase